MRTGLHAATITYCRGSCEWKSATRVWIEKLALQSQAGTLIRPFRCTATPMGSLRALVEKRHYASHLD